MSLCQQRCDLALGSLIMMCLARVVGPCRGNIEYLGKHTSRSSCAFSKQGDENSKDKIKKTKKNKKDYQVKLHYVFVLSLFVFVCGALQFVKLLLNLFIVGIWSISVCMCSSFVYICFFFYTVCPKRSS